MGLAWPVLAQFLKASGDGPSEIRAREEDEGEKVSAAKQPSGGDSRLRLLRLLPANPGSLPSVHRSRDLRLGLGRGLADFHVRHFAWSGCHGFNLRATPFGEFPGDGKTHGPIRV